MKRLIQSFLSIFDSVGKVAVNKTDGSNQAVIAMRNKANRLRQACNEAEKINTFILRNMNKFDKKDQVHLSKWIDRFNLFD